MITIVSSSLNPDSNSRILARSAQRQLERQGIAPQFLDLRELPLPLCDGSAAYAHPHVARASELLRGADAILVATAVYNYDANAAVKNLIELTGDAWRGKVVGFLCAAGGLNSYMSILSLANSLMLDFRAVIVPRFVYATSEAFENGGIVDGDIQHRVAELAQETARMGDALAAMARVTRAPVLT